jgi:hypothetical protein
VIEQNEEIREEAETGARRPGRFENIPSARMEGGGQRDQFSARTAINGWLSIQEKNGG